MNIYYRVLQSCLKPPFISLYVASKYLFFHEASCIEEPWRTIPEDYKESSACVEEAHWLAYILTLKLIRMIQIYYLCGCLK